MTTGDPEDGDDVLARLRAARPDRDAPDLADRACMARLERLKGPAPEVAAGGYVIEQCVGEGAYGTVYRARHPRVEKLVALKHLRRDVAQQIGSAARSLREANSLGKLNHPNVVQVFDVVEDGDDTYIAMEYVDGESLVRWQHERRAWTEVLSVYLQVGDGLAAAHAAGLLHLDLKPANVLVGRDGRVRVVDFGLARQVAAPVDATDDKAGETLIEQAPARGTIPYSSPEQRVGDDVDARSDQYSFCVALYEALHGELPFTANELARMRHVGFDRPLRGARGRIPRRIDAALRRGLWAEPGGRWPDMRSLLGALRRPAWYQRPFTWAFVGAAIVAVPAALAFPTDRAACPDPREVLAEAWDDQRSAEVDAAFATSTAPYAERVAKTTNQWLDAYAEEWSAQLREACASKPRGLEPTADPRIACLVRARDRLARVSRMLANGDPDVLEHADDLVHALGPAHGCASAGTTPEPVRPTDSESLAEVDRARLWLAAGRPADARDSAERAVVLAEALADQGARGEAYLVRGEVLVGLGRAQDAMQDLETAVAHAIAAGRDDIAAAAWLELVRVAAIDLGDADLAERWLRLAEAAVTRIGRPPLAQADVLERRGLYESLRGDHVAAEAAHRAALVELSAVLEPDDPRWTITWMRLANVRLERGDPGEARELDLRALELRERRLGPEHPEVARALVALTLVTRDIEHDAALAYLTRAIEIVEKNYGTTSVRLGSLLALQAELLLAVDEVDEADAIATKAWELQREQLPITDRERAHGALEVLLAVADRKQDFVRLLQLSRTAGAEAVARGDSLGAATMDNAVAYALCELGRYDDAKAIYEGLRAHASRDPVILAYAAAGLGRVELETGHPRSALEHLEAGAQEMKALQSPDPAAFAEVQWLLAQALARTGGPADRVRGLATAALGFYESAGQPEEIRSIRELIAGVASLH